MSHSRFTTIPQDLRENLRLNERLSTLVSHLLVSGMMACLVASLVLLFERLLPSWNGDYLPWLCFFVALEAMYTKRATRKLGLGGREWIIYRGSELIVLLLGLKILLYLINDPSRFWTDLPLWQENFVENFFSGDYPVAIFFVLSIWVYSSVYSENLAQMEGDERLLEKEVPVGFSADRLRARQQMVDWMIITGAIMVIATAMVRLDLTAVWGSRPPSTSGVVYVLLYFMFGLALLSQTQFAILKAGWTWERTRLDKNVAKRWTAYSLLFLIALAALALALPTRYSLGFLTVLGYLIGLVVYLVIGFWGVIAWFFTSILSLLQGKNLETPTPTPPPTPVPMQTEIPNTPLAIPWLEALKSILFWVIFLGVIVFSVHQYLGQNQVLLTRLRGFPALVWLRKAWQWLRESLSGVNRTVNYALNAGLQRLRRPLKAKAIEQTWRYVNIRRLPPRQRILFFYLALVRRADESGIRRAIDETPYEYQEKLRAVVVEAEEDLTGLTEAFVEARYSLHPITPEKAGLVQRWWQAVRRKLRR